MVGDKETGSAAEQFPKPHDRDSAFVQHHLCLFAPALLRCSELEGMFAGDEAKLSLISSNQQSFICSFLTADVSQHIVDQILLASDLFLPSAATLFISASHAASHNFHLVIFLSDALMVLHPHSFFIAIPRGFLLFIEK